MNTAFARRKKYSKGWWPDEIRHTDVSMKNDGDMWWPWQEGFQPSGRVSVVKEPWEPPQPAPSFPKSTITWAESVDYWGGTAAKVAYGNTMNTFQCLRLGSTEATNVVARITAALPSELNMLKLNPTSISRLKLQHTADHGVSQLEIEFGGQRSRQHRRGHFIVWPATLGATYYVEATAKVPQKVAKAYFPSARKKSIQDDKQSKVGMTDTVPIKIRVAGTYGSDGRLELTELRVVRTGSDILSMAQLPPKWHPGLTIMSFNVWNTNPPQWLLKGDQRQARYFERMDHLASIIKATRPMIIGFQEVRYDASITGQSGQLQMAHLVKRLPEYRHYAYIPAMSYYDTRALRREEEGPAIASIYPIVHTEYVLLSRDLGDPERDGHQRACIHAVIDVPGWGLVDVFTVHLSLAEEARERSVRELWHAVTDKDQSRGVTQILLGDLNAEPQERAMRYLAGEEDIEGEKAGFTDAWLAVHPEPTPRSNDTWDRAQALTFPSDAPSKRIDFIFVKGKGADSIRKTWLVGQDAKPGIGRDKSDDGEHFGMVHQESKLWASDHRAIVTQLGGAVDTKH